MHGFKEDHYHQVVVVNSNATQKHLFTSVLNKSKHAIRFVDHFSELCPKTDETYAIIVCHKTCVDTPKPEVPIVHGDERIIILSDNQVEQHIVEALEHGAHHYFDIRESKQVTEARLHAALKQHKLLVAEYLPYKFSMVEKQVEVDGIKVQLNPREFDCAHYLFRHSNRVIKIEELMVSVWALPPHLDSRRIDTAMCRLRRKLALHNWKHGWYLQRIRGIGFRLTNEIALSTSRH